MTISDDGSFFDSDTPERARAFRSLLVSLALTPVLLAIPAARQIVSLDATLAAIVVGVFLGAVAAIGFDDGTVGEGLSDFAQTIVLVVFIGVMTAAVWLLVPSEHIGTFIHFTIAFVWALPLTQLIYTRLLQTVVLE